MDLIEYVESEIKVTKWKIKSLLSWGNDPIDFSDEFARLGYWYDMRELLDAR